MAHPHAPALAKVVRAILNSLKTEFVRKRLTGPRQMLAVLLTQIHSGVNRVGMKTLRLMSMQSLPSLVGWDVGAMPSTSAVCRAIRKLTPDMLEGVGTLGLKLVNEVWGSHALVHGYRLVAIDGVRINCQRTSSLARWLGLPRQGKGKKAHQPQALVVTARCVITGVTLAEEVVRHNGSERECARKMLDRLSQIIDGRILVVLDRGFPARDLIEQLFNRRIAFVVRMCGGKRTWRELQGYQTGPAHDTKITMRLRDEHGRYVNRKVRCILSRPILRGRPNCNRKPERTLLLTNLMESYWKAERVIAVYLRRWAIETTFREDKRLLGTTRSHATTKIGFTVELLALRIYRILMALVTAMLVATAGSPAWDDPTAPRFNTPQIILAAWWLLEMAGKPPRKDFDPLLWALTEIFRDAEKRRPFRQFERRCKGVEGAWKNKVEKGHR